MKEINSYYKIKKINNKFNIFKNKKRIAELGCYPGGWTKYLKELNIKNFISIDIKKTKYNKNYLMGSINNNLTKKKIKKIFIKKICLIISDSCPKLTNSKYINKIFLERHLKKIFFFTYEFLKKGGSIIYKTMNYVNYSMIKKFLRNFQYTKKIEFVKKKRSSEIYYYHYNFLK
ncbi:SAM-dependent methyltransferase [Candidatus Vidania fulgoroideorum]